MSKFFNIRQYSCLFMMIMIALTLLLSACPSGDDDDSSTSDGTSPGGTPNAPTCPVDDTCISVFEATSELNKANLTVTNKLGTALPLAFNVRVHVVPKGTNTVAESDDYPIARGTATIDGNTPPLFSAGLGLSWTLADTALASDASETAIIEVTETLAPGKRLLACIYENSSIGATDIPPIVCKKLDSVDLIMNETIDSDTRLVQGQDPVSSSGIIPSYSGGVFSLHAGIKNAGTLDYVAPTDAAEITGIDVYHNNEDTVYTTYPAATARTDKKIDNKVDTDHLTSDIVSDAIYETNVAFQDPFTIENRHTRKIYACVARVAKEFYVHNNCHFAIIDLSQNPDDQEE